MFSHTLLDDISDMLQGRGKLLQFVVAESYVVGNVALIASAVERFLELSLSRLVLFFFIKETSLGNDCLV